LPFLSLAFFFREKRTYRREIHLLYVSLLNSRPFNTAQGEGSFIKHYNSLWLMVHPVFSLENGMRANLRTSNIQDPVSLLKAPSIAIYSKVLHPIKVYLQRGNSISFWSLIGNQCKNHPNSFII